MPEIRLVKKYPHIKDEDVISIFQEGYVKGFENGRKDAIPIEWLKAYFKKCLSFDDRVFIDNEDSNYDIVIDKYKIFEEWEKENAEVTD